MLVSPPLISSPSIYHFMIEDTPPAYRDAVLFLLHYPQKLLATRHSEICPILQITLLQDDIHFALYAKGDEQEQIAALTTLSLYGEILLQERPLTDLCEKGPELIALKAHLDFSALLIKIAYDQEHVQKEGGATSTEDISQLEKQIKGVHFQLGLFFTGHYDFPEDEDTSNTR